VDRHATCEERQATGAGHWKTQILREIKELLERISGDAVKLREARGEELDRIKPSSPAATDSERDADPPGS
jgi:hypothetical protein